MNGARPWSPIQDVAAMVERRWQEYGLDDLELTEEVDPNLFGYDMR